MFNYGRTTDNEWIYEVTLDEQGNIISEIFQGPSHTTTDFSGQKINKHPIMKMKEGMLDNSISHILRLEKHLLL